MARDVGDYRKLQVETNKHNTEMAKALETAYADISATVEKAESIANTKFLTEVDKRIEEMLRVARVDFVTEFRRCEARLLTNFNARTEQSAKDIESRVSTKFDCREARMAQSIENRLLTKMRTNDAELPNKIETKVQAKVQAESAADIEAGVLAKVQICNAELAKEIEAGVLSKIHDRIAELIKNVAGRNLAEIDKTSFPDTAERHEEIERYVDMRARVEGAFRASHDENGSNGRDDDRDHGSGGEAPARVPHSFEVLGVDRAGAERVRHNGRTYMCPVDPDDALGVEQRLWHHFEVVDGQNVISYKGRVFVLDS